MNTLLTRGVVYSAHEA